MYKIYWVTKDGDARGYNLTLGNVTVSLVADPNNVMFLATLQGRGGIRTGVERSPDKPVVYSWLTIATNKRDYKAETQFSLYKRE